MRAHRLRLREIQVQGQELLLCTCSVTDYRAGTDHTYPAVLTVQIFRYLRTVQRTDGRLHQPGRHKLLDVYSGAYV